MNAEQKEFWMSFAVYGLMWGTCTVMVKNKELINGMLLFWILLELMKMRIQNQYDRVKQ